MRNRLGSSGRSAKVGRWLNLKKQFRENWSGKRNRERGINLSPLSASFQGDFPRKNELSHLFFIFPFFHTPLENSAKTENSHDLFAVD